jgi:hypothetical protein
MNYIIRGENNKIYIKSSFETPSCGTTFFSRQLLFVERHWKENYLK